MAESVFWPVIGLALFAAALASLWIARGEEDRSVWYLLAAGLALLAGGPLLAGFEAWIMGPVLSIMAGLGSLVVLGALLLLMIDRRRAALNAIREAERETCRRDLEQLRILILDEDWQAVEKTAAEQVIRHCFADSAMILELDPTGRRLEVSRRAGLLGLTPPELGFAAKEPTPSRLLAMASPSPIPQPPEGDRDTLAAFLAEAGLTAGAGAGLADEQGQAWGALTVHSSHGQEFEAGALAFLGEVRDLLNRARSLRVQKEARRTYELVREGTTDVAFCFDPRHYVTYINESGRKMLGIPVDDKARFRLLDLLPGWALDKIEMEGIPQASQSGFWSGETALIARSGREIPIEQVLLAHRSEGQVQFFTSFGFDLMRSSYRNQSPTYSELSRSIDILNERLRDSAQEVEQFAQATGRRLQEPIAAAASFSRSLRGDPGTSLSADGTRYVDLITEAARSAGEVVLRLNQVARLHRQPLVFEEVNMGALAKSAYRELAADEEHHFLVRTLFPVLGDRRQLKTVYLNLVSNALKFSRGVKEPEIEVGSRSEGDRYIYYVRDNGVGFNMSDMDRLFQLFQRLHDRSEYEGIGAGLFEVKRIVHRHGGEVWAQGGRERGATFYFSLPARQVVD